MNKRKWAAGARLPVHKKSDAASKPLRPAITYKRMPPAARRLLPAYCLLLLLFGVPATGCKRGGEPGTLVVAVELPPRGFDPRFSTTIQSSARIMQLVYDTLLVKNEKFEFVPSLADSFTESEDHKTFTFRLRSGVVFHDGRPLTSADVKYTFDSIIAPATRSPIRGAVDKITSIEAPDPLTVIFHAGEPFYTFTGNLPAIGIIPEGAGPELVNAPVGSGPYRLVSYAEGDAVKLEANQGYWGGPPNIPRVHIKVVTDNSTRQAELMSGEVDLAYNAQFDPETIRALKDRRDMQVVIGEGANIGYLGANITPSSLLSNQKVRQAVAYGIDREVIIHRLLRDQARKANAMMPPEHWAYDSNITVYDHDAGHAAALLDEAGYPDPDGDGPQPRLTLRIMTSTTQLSRNIAAIIQDQLRRIGVRLELDSFESATLFDKLAKAQYDLYYLIGLGFNQSTDAFQFVYHSRYQNPQFSEAVARLRALTDPAQMRPLFDQLDSILARGEYCPSPEVDRLREQAAADANAAAKKQLYLRVASLLTDRGGQNRMRYCNPQVDGWIAGAERVNDRAAKADLYFKVQKTVSDELPQIYLWYPANVLAARQRVGNIRLEPSGSWYFITKLTLDEK
ncbi:MAG TPA: ABC transporter substrate-binding protein [Blastocatellia bacterium]|jgi:peptide/nickel transport system substrate-binding protein|nr:ABC transporter substrate-binding protein [Blastocatellia bacterium]